MLAFHQPSYAVRQAVAREATLVSYLRFASLVCLEMPGQPLDAVRTVMSALPDVDPALVRAGQYQVADLNGELIGGAGWSVLPLNFRGERLLDEAGRPATLDLAGNTVLLRGFFLDPDVGRRGAGAALLSQVEAEWLSDGFEAAELVAPAMAEPFYRGLGFRPLRKLQLDMRRTGMLPMLEMRKCLSPRLALAA